MSNPYAAKLPPAMVTVENGFCFSSGTLDDSDLSSLNTTPSKSSVDRKVLRLAPREIDKADLGLKLSRANRINPYRIPGEKDSTKPFDESSIKNEQQDSTKNSPPFRVLVQIDRVQDVIPVETKGNDPRVVNDQGNQGNKNREAALKDRKEKYRRIAAEPTTASTRRMRGDGKLNSWKKKADERRTKAERGMPWYVPADAPDDYDPADAPDDEADEVISPFKAAPDDTGDKFDSSIKASKHLVQDEPKQECYPESKQEKRKNKVPAEMPESAPDVRRKNRSVMGFKKRSKAPWEDALVKAPYSSDMYGCPIFQVESEEEEGEPQGDLTEAKAKLNQLDKTKSESLASMLSNASFFSAKAVAQKLTEDASKLLEKTGQAVEDIVLGPVEEVDESAMLNTSSETDDSESPPPPKTPPRKTKWWLEDELGRRRVNSESPKKTERAQVSIDSERSMTVIPKQFANVEALVAQEPVEVEEPAEADISVHAESEIVDTSFVLDDASDVDVTHILNESSSDKLLDDASDDKQVNELAQSNAQELRTAKATVNMYDWQAQQKALKEKDRMRKMESAEFLHSYRGNTAETSSKLTSIKQEGRKGKEDAARFLQSYNSAKVAVDLNSSAEGDKLVEDAEEAVNTSAFLNISSAADENENCLTTSFVLGDLANFDDGMNKATDKKDDGLPTGTKILVSPEGAKLLEGAVRALIECSFLNSSPETSFLNMSSDTEYLELSRPPSKQHEKAYLRTEIESSPGDVKEFPMEGTRPAAVNEPCASASDETVKVVEYGSQGVSTEKDIGKKELETEEVVVTKYAETPEEHNSGSNELPCGEDAVDLARSELSKYTARSVVPAFYYESKEAEDLSSEKQAEDLSSQNEPTQGVITDLDQNALRDSSDGETKDYHATAAIVAGAAALATVLASPVIKPVGDSVSQPVVSDESKKTLSQSKVALPEFPPPPTDDADLEFDLASVVTQSSENTPVRNNLDESKVVVTKATKTRVSAATSVRPKMAKKTSLKEAPNTKSAVVDAAKSKPAMVKTLDDTNGIAKGDIFISLLNSNLNEANRAPKGADQVRDAIFRMRSMRRRQEKEEMVHFDPEETHPVPTPSKRSILPVNLDDMRVVSGFDHIKTLEDEAIEHLRRDEIDAAIELYDEIASTYAESFIETENKKQKLSRKKPEKDRQSWYKAYIGAVLHNIGILHLLKFDFDKALYHFIRAAANRKIHFGAGSVDHLASLSKIAVCYFAMNDFEEAHKGLEEVLELSKNHLAGLTDFMQIAETLNNLGVLSFMCGQSEAAMTMFKECSEIQNAVLKQSLYGGPRLGGHATSLAISVTRGNVGYIRMLTKNAGAAIVEFESSLMHQQMILSDAHDTVICTMDHLAVTHLLAHNKEEATKMLSRMLRAQLDAYGPDDERCVLTLSKLQLVQTRKTDYLEKALEQLWSQHTSASISSKSSKLSTNAKSKNMLKKFSFVKKVAKLSH